MLKIDDERYSNHLKYRVIKKYISLEVIEAAKRAGFSEPCQSQVNAKLSGVAPLNFLWVNMACRRIESHGLSWNATRILNELPRNMKTLYREAYAMINTNETLKD